MLRVDNPKERSNAVRKRSVVWRFFKTIDSGSVQCLLCRGYQSRHDHGSTTAMLRHLRVKHPKEVGKKRKDLIPETSSGHRGPETDGEEVCSVEIALEDGDSDNPTTVSEFDINSADIVEAVQGGPAEQMTHDEISDDRPVTHKGQKRSLIWRYFHRLYGLDAARCHICMKKLQCCESGGTSNLRRHLSKRHPEAFSALVAEGRNGQPSNLTASSNANGDMMKSPETVEATEQSVFSVDVSLEDGDSDSPTNVNPSDSQSALNGSVEAAQGQAERIKHEKANDERPLIHRRHTRSLIWRHFERLESLDAARCRICSKKLQCFESGGTSNLRRHMSNRHPEVFSRLVSEGHIQPPSNSALSLNVNGETWTSVESAGYTEQKVFSASRASDGEKRVLRRERELIEALRRAQKEEAQALDHQRELLEKLRAADAREAAAEREKIESLRKAQQEEAQDLSRQREELQKEKAELQKKWEELQQGRGELLLLATGQ